MANKFIPHKVITFTEEERLKKSNEFYTFLNKRRSIRDYSPEEIDPKVIENIVKAAATAPSGAHKQPWTFCVVSNPELKKQIRIAAEEEELKNYNGRMSKSWIKELEPFGTNEKKPFLEDAPYLIIVCKRVYETIDEEKKNNYYVNESVGIAVGMLISAIHAAGLVTLTHTPSPLGFLTKILNRPSNERPFLLLPVGLPKKESLVPQLERKQIDEVLKMYN